MGASQGLPKKRKKPPAQLRKHAAADKPAASGNGKKRFQLDTLLGAGGMCEVFSALDLCRLEWNDTAPRVAVKRLLPELAENRHAQLALAQEFFTLRHLAHPGIVRAYELHREPEGLCYSMELLEGLSLHQAQAAAPSGLGKDGLRIAAKLFETLAYLHEKDVVHADIKPANLFTAPAGRLVLIDFNIAQVTPRPGMACSPVAQGLRATLKIPAHSLLHASPERLKTGCPSPADDIFAACCTVYELIEGRHPFKRISSLEAEERKLQAPKPGVVSGLQWKMLRQGLSFSAADRPDAGKLHRAFETHSLFSRLRFSLTG